MVGPTWAPHVILTIIFFLLSPQLPFISLPSPLSSLQARVRSGGAWRRREMEWRAAADE
jgi:hypothetical protein